MRCPVCKADNDQGPQCRRCKADLSLLFALEEQRQKLLAAACGQLIQGRYPQALASAQRAAALRRDEDARCLIAVSRLLGWDFAGAWRNYTELSMLPRRGFFL
jgi:hypothetical protein